MTKISGGFYMRTLFLSLILAGCPSYPDADKGAVTEVTTPDPTDTSTPPLSPDDTAESDPPVDPPPVDPAPMGSWSDCRGEFTLSDDGYSWSDAIDDCELNGEAVFEEGVLTLNTDGFDDCETIPWWLNIFEEDAASFVTGVGATRLTLIPTIPVGAGRVAQFTSDLTVEQWSLTSDDGNNSWFRLCWADESNFFGGMYRALDDACDFLSCGGSIFDVERSEAGENWLTRCSGDCPCTGVVTVDERTDDALTGHFNGSNCAITLSGTYTGTPYP
jgi:hypothetical protein